MKNSLALKKLTDLELITTLCSTEDDAQAYEEFVYRFLPDVEKGCKGICKTRKLDLHVGQQIAHESFERVRKYKSFRKDGIKLHPDRKAVIVYLYRICTTLFNDHYNKNKKAEVVHKTYFDEISEAATTLDIKDLTKKRDLSVAIFNKLNPKEKQVFLTDLQYKKQQKYLPDEVTDNLAATLGVKPATIREIRERAIEKIKKAIDEINQQ